MISNKNTSNVFAENGAFSEYIKQLTLEDKFSGVVLIAKDDKVLFEKAYGMADRSRNLFNDTNTKFNLGSIPKMFTATAIAQLVEQKKLMYSDTIDKYINFFKDNIVNRITIEQFLTHTSGIGDIFTPDYFAHKDEVSTINEFMSYVINQPLQFEPGQRYEYSNGGFIVLGAIIEKVSGESYYEYIRNHITVPLKMMDTDFYKKYDDVPNLAHGYTKYPTYWEPNIPSEEIKRMIENGETKLEENMFFLPLVGQPSGGGYSTVRDMLRFSTALTQHTILSKESIDLITTGKVDKPLGKYGYGFEDLLENGFRTIGHAGGAPGISAVFRILINENYTVIILSNYDSGRRKPYGEFLRLISEM